MSERIPRGEAANNFVNDTQIHLYARRVASRVPQPARDRFVNVSYGVLHSDPRNARPLMPDELPEAPDWAQRAFHQGRPLHVFTPHPDAVAPVRFTARALKDTVVEFNFLDNAPKKVLTPRDIVIWQETREFLAKISRMSFAVIALKAAKFKDERRRRMEAAADGEFWCVRDEIYTAPGRSWSRVRSIGELCELGRELGNCLRRPSPQHAGFARRLKAGTTSFWALRDHCGAALIAAMADSASGRLLDVRASRNMHVRLGDPDLAILMQVRGLSLSPSVFFLPPRD